MHDLSGFVAIVTGGTSGIGLETVRLFLEAGAAVGLCGRDPSRLAQANAALLADYPDAKLFAGGCDVLCKDDVARFAHDCEAALGPADILVNNAGQGRMSTFQTTDDDAWTQELQLKFFSIIHPVRGFLPQLRKSSHAAIVCVNSLLAIQPEPYMVATSAARAGVHNLVRSLATELAPDAIRVNGILLGLIESGQWHRRFEAREDRDASWREWTAALARDRHIPLGRLGLAQEAARSIFFLASPLSSYTTGSHLDVSGGHNRHA